MMEPTKAKLLDMYFTLQGTKVGKVMSDDDILEQSVIAGLNKHDSETFKEYQTYLNMKWFLQVSTFQAGDTFGELALLRDDKRAATVQCLSEKCYFATVDKAGYQKVLKGIELSKLKMK